MKILITHKAVVEMSEAAFAKFQADAEPLLQMLAESDLGSSEVRRAVPADGPKLDDWDDEYCEVEDEDPTDKDDEPVAPEENYGVSGID